MSKLDDYWKKLPPLFDDEFAGTVSSSNYSNNSIDEKPKTYYYRRSFTEKDTINEGSKK